MFRSVSWGLLFRSEECYSKDRFGIDMYDEVVFMISLCWSSSDPIYEEVVFRWYYNPMLVFRYPPPAGSYEAKGKGKKGKEGKGKSCWKY